jgi:hypothetical protein
MAGSISSQVLEEVRELRTDIHKIDTKLEVHIAQDTKIRTDTDKLCKEVFNGNGLRERLGKLESSVQVGDKKEETKEKFSLNIKTALITGTAMLVISTIAQALVAKLF